MKISSTTPSPSRSARLPGSGRRADVGDHRRQELPLRREVRRTFPHVRPSAPEWRSGLPVHPSPARPGSRISTTSVRWGAVSRVTSRQRFGPRRIGVPPVERDEVEEVDAAPALSLVVRLRPVRDYRPQGAPLVALNAEGECMRRQIASRSRQTLRAPVSARSPRARRRAWPRPRGEAPRLQAPRACWSPPPGSSAVVSVAVAVAVAVVGWRRSGFYRRARRWSRLRRAARHGHEARAGEQERGEQCGFP